APRARARAPAEARGFRAWPIAYSIRPNSSCATSAYVWVASRRFPTFDLAIRTIQRRHPMSRAYSPIRLLAYFAYCAVTPACLAGQMIDLRPGARVRVTAPGVLAGRLEGTIIERSADSIVVATTQAAQYRIGLSSASSISDFEGRRRLPGAGKG